MAEKIIMLKLGEEIHRKFKVYAATHSTTMQALLEQYVISLVKGEDTND